MEQASRRMRKGRGWGGKGGSKELKVNSKGRLISVVDFGAEKVASRRRFHGFFLESPETQVFGEEMGRKL